MWQWARVFAGLLAGCSLQDEHDSGWHPERDPHAPGNTLTDYYNSNLIKKWYLHLLEWNPHATGNTLTDFCNSNSIRNWYLHLEWNPHATGGAHM